MGKEGAGKTKVVETHLEVDGNPTKSSPKLGASDGCTSNRKGKMETKATPPLPESKDRRSPYCMAN